MTTAPLRPPAGTPTTRRAAAAGLALALALPVLAATPAAATDPVGPKYVVGDTVGVHDPALVVEGDTWWVYSTGLDRSAADGTSTLEIRSSDDGGTTWERRGNALDAIPAWLLERFPDGADPDDDPELTNLWAPEIVLLDGVYHLYYSASTFGSNTSVIALATSPTLDPADPDFGWVDRGEVLSSSPATTVQGVQVNAIDPGVVVDADGTPYLTFGSHWSGIWVVELSAATGLPAADWRTTATHLVDRFDGGPNAVEAPYVVERDGYHYLFVSFDRCCAGADSTYSVAVGRSRSVTGPYLDQTGRDLRGTGPGDAAGGGTVLLASAGDMVGPGGQSYSEGYLAHHYYDAANGYRPTLGVQRVDWSGGWPALDRSGGVRPPAFVDVPAGAPFAEDIGWLALHRLAEGTVTDGERTFLPAAPMSRQAMAAFLHRYAGGGWAPPEGTQTFPDVAPGHPFHAAVEWMAAQGLATGYADGTFRGTAPVSRQATAAFLHRLAGEPGATTAARFADVGPGHPFAAAIAWLEEAGIAEGYGDGTFGTTLPVTRQAMAAFLHRYDAAV